jgi:putative component of membrane protein insertase Oxa1/YidC/SpoIIIJ protein YidD
MKLLLKTLFLLILMMGWLPSPGFSSDDRGPTSKPERTETAALGDASDVNIGAWSSSFFRKHISPVDGDRCPSYPTCASYSISAFKKHGFFMGWLMTVDRLIHEGSEETAVSPMVYDRVRQRIFDPVENNDFWWFRADGKGQE